MVFWGYLGLGIGFVAMGLAPSLVVLAIASAVAGFSGVLNDLPLVDMIQGSFAIHEIPKIFRLRTAGEIAASLLCFLVSPVLFRLVPVGTVIWAIGGVFLLIAAYGITFCSKAIAAKQPSF
jgi:hypothetical protein